MIRPIFGPPINTVGTEDVILRGEEILLWPNPVSETLMIRRSDLIPGNETVIVTDMSGRERIRKTYENEIDVSSLYPGMYILRIVNGKSTVSTKRFIIAR
jgi:hypothetical protein